MTIIQLTMLIQKGGVHSSFDMLENISFKILITKVTVHINEWW